MATIAKLDVLLGLQDGAFERGLENSRQKLDKWGSSLRSMGTKLTAGVTTPIVGSGLAVVKWASDLEQTLGATEQLWGDNTDTMLAWAQSADRSMGMTENSALQNANRFNAMFKQMDAGNDTIMDMSKEFTQLSADLSAMWGGSPDEAANRLTSALRGNYEGLDQYNINLTEALVNQEAMNIAMADGRDTITEGDKVQARYNLVMEQSADAQGQFARETDTTAGKLAIATARAKNAATTFGRLLLPYVNKLLDGFSKMVDWIENLSDTQRKWVLGIAAVAAAIGPLLIAIGMLLPGISGLIAVIGFLVSPIGLVVVAIAALVAGLVWAYTEFEGFRNVVDSVASAVRDVLIGAFNMAVDAFNKLKDAFKADGWTGLISTLGSMIMNGLSSVFNAIRNIDWGALVQGGWNVIQNGISLAWDAITSLDWGEIIPAFGEWSVWIAYKLGDLAAWGIGKFGEWGSWLFKISGLSGWGIGEFGDWKDWLFKIGSLAKWGIPIFGGWKSYLFAIEKLADWGVPGFGVWSDWMFKIDSLAAWGIGQFGEWLDYLTNPFADIKIPEWPGWGAFFDWVNPFGGDDAATTPAPETTTDAATGISRTPRTNEGPYGTQSTQWDRDTSPAFAGMREMFKVGQIFNDAAGSALSFNDALGVLNPSLGASNANTMKLASTVPMYTSGTRDADVATGAMAGNMGTSFAAIASNAASHFSAARNSAVTLSSEMQATTTNNVGTMASNVGSRILGMQVASAVQMGLMASTAKTSGTEMGTGMTGWILGAQLNMTAGLALMVASIRNVGGAGYDAGYYAGSQISLGFANGMRAYLGQIYASANEMVNAASRAVIAKAMIASPSKLFERYGIYMGEGMEKGILSTLGDIGRAADRMIDVGIPGGDRFAFAGSGYAPQPAQQTIVNQFLLTPEAIAQLEDGALKGQMVHELMTDRNAGTGYGGRR